MDGVVKYLKLDTQDWRQLLNAKLFRCLLCTTRAFTTVIVIDSQLLRGREPFQTFLQRHHLAIILISIAIIPILGFSPLSLILWLELKREIHNRVHGRGDVVTVSACDIALEFAIVTPMNDALACLGFCI